MMIHVHLVTPIILARAPEGADQSLAPWFRSLKVPSNTSTYPMSCCDVSDCREANERSGPASEHEVFIDKDTFGPDAPNDWVKVPASAILYGHDNPTGQSVVCWWQGRVLCYVPGPGL
jgi:hypothetical protein